MQSQSRRRRPRPSDASRGHGMVTDTDSSPGRRRRRPGNGESASAARLEDVARLAGVSTATVSRVLNGREIVSAQLRESVENAVQQLGYVRDGAARALASRRSHSIGALIPTLEAAIFARCVEALQKRIYESGFTLLLATYDYDPERERRQVVSLVERSIDGLVLVGEERSNDIYGLLNKKGIPYVNTWIYRADSPHPCVGFDNFQAGYRIAAYLMDIGHRNIAMVAGLTPTNDRARQRVEGVQAAMRERGLTFARGHLLERPYEISAGRQAGSRLLSAPRRPTAIITGEDVLALGVALECRARNVSVPGDISVTGFDDLDIAAIVEPALTTVRVPSEEMGTTAGEYLLAYLDNTPAPQKTELEAALIVRGSTAPPRTT